MVKLSDRLNAVAKEFKRGETMADIGTDHGYLPVYLWENSLSPYVIMTDINEGPLSVARENCRRSRQLSFSVSEHRHLFPASRPPYFVCREVS